MSRSLSTANQAQVQAPERRLVYFIKVAFPSGTIYAVTANRSFEWGGQEWSAQWLVLGVPEVTEKADLKSYAGEIVFSGVNATLRSKVMNDKYSRAEVGYWKGFCDENWKLVGDPHPVATRRKLSQCRLRMDGKTGTIKLQAHGPEVNWRRDSAQLATPESQRLRYPTDTGLDRVLDQGTKVIEWGGRLLRGGGGGGGGGGGHGLGAPIAGGSSDTDHMAGRDNSSTG